MQEFYILKDFKLISQKKENWCWAACGAMIANYFNTKPGNNSLIHFVRDGLEDNSCSLDNNICDKTLPAKKIKRLYSNFNIHCKERKPSNINNFNSVKSFLEKNKSPIVGGVRIMGRTNHLILIVGYGYCSNKKYLLVFDPNGSKLYTKYENDIFMLKFRKFNLFWETKLKTGINNKRLEKINNINKFIDSNYQLENNFIIDNESISFLKNKAISKSKKVQLSLYKDSHFSITSLNTSNEIDCESIIEIFVARPGVIKDLNSDLKLLENNINELKFTIFNKFNGIYSLSQSNGKFQKNYNLPNNLEKYTNKNVNEITKIINY